MNFEEKIRNKVDALFPGATDVDYENEYKKYLAETDHEIIKMIEMFLQGEDIKEQLAGLKDVLNNRKESRVKAKEHKEKHDPKPKPEPKPKGEV